jgi:thiol-disulfide isomerase/thioredoxin
MKLLSTFIIFFAAAGLAHAGEKAHLGGKIAAFERKDSSGASVALATALAGKKAVVVDFWSARCPVSARYEPTLVKLAADYAGKGVGFVTVDANFQETPDEIERVRGERSVPYPVLVDAATGELAAYFGASHTPEAYVIAADGTLVYHGNLDEIGAALDEVLAGKLVTKADTRAFGCSIKRPH